MKFSHYIESLPYEIESASRIIHESILDFFEDNQFEISHDEFVVLDTLIIHPGILQIDLARLILKGRAHTGRFLAALEKKALVNRHPLLRGKKQVISNTITDKGLKVHKKISSAIQKHIIEVNSELTDDKVQELIKLLNILKSDVSKKCNVKFE